MASRVHELGAGAPRVLFINPGRALGGAEHSLLLLLAGLRARDVAVAVALFGNGALCDRLAAHGVRTAIVRAPRRFRRAGRYRAPRTLAGALPIGAAGLLSAIRLAALARRIRADVIHTNGMKAHFLGGVAGRVAGVPVVWHLRDLPGQDLVGKATRVAARVLPSLVIANSAAVASAVTPSEGAGRAPIITLYNPVDLAQFGPSVTRARLRRELGLTADTPLVGLVAHLTPWKGHFLFLQIASSLSDRLGDVRFVIAGGPIYETNGHAGYAEALRRQAHELGLGGRVAFLGARDDVPEILAAIDVLVHCPTAPEPFGRVLAEAMAVGRPVVAARCGGIPEVIQDGVTGVLVAPGDAEAFAAAVVDLLRDAPRRRRLGDAGRRRAEALFGIDGHADAVLGAYRMILTGRRSVA